MTQISVQVQTPGAADSAIALNRAADAVEKLAKGMEHQRAASAAAATETKKAAQAARELADAEARAAKAAADADAAWVQRARTTTAMGREVRSRSVSIGNGAYDTVRMADPGQFTPEWARGGGPPGGGNAAGAATRWGRLAGILPALGASIPGAGGVLGGIAGGGSIAAIAAGAAAIGVGLATAANYIRNAEEAAANIAKTMISMRKGFSEALLDLGKRGGAASDQSGSLLLSALARNGNAVGSARQSVAGLANVTTGDALSFEKLGLSDTQKQAASIASVISGRSAGDIAEQIAKGRINGSDPNRIAALVLSNSGTPTSPKAVAARFAQATSGSQAKAVLDRVKETGLAGLEGLGTIPAGVNAARGDRAAQALAMNPEAAANAAAYATYQDQRAPLEAEADAETWISRWIGNAFGRQSSASARLRRYDEQFGAALFSENSGSKVVIATGAKN